MKKKLLYIAAIIICLSIITGGTYAYFTASDTARNFITSKSVEIEEVEQQLVDGALQPYPNEPIPIMPGGTVSKIVSVKNIDAAAWVRVNYTITIYDADGENMDVSAEELENLITIRSNRSGWLRNNDGWWYCNEAVQTGETSVPLFEEVVFSGPNMGNEYQNCTVVIDVTAQAVQEANNGTTVMEAMGWPEN